MSYNKKSSKRCRNFNDDGEPIGRGCTRTNCHFTHPTDPAWAQAQPNRRRNSDVSFNPSHLPDSGWASQSGGPSSSTTKDWDTSLWDSPSKKKTDGKSTTNNRGSQSSAKKDATAASPTPSVSYDWNMTTDKGESSKSGTEEGWGNVDLPAIDVSSSWGGGNTGEGWGGGGSDGWGGGKTGNDTNTSGNDQKGKRKEKEREDVEMSDPLPSKTAVGSSKPISLSHTKPESAPPPPPSARNTPPPSTVASKPARPIPLPLTSKQKKAKLYEDGNLTKLALLNVKNKEAEQVQEKPKAPSFRGPEGRADLFSQVLKHSTTTVILQVELQHAQRDLARWKRTQESAQYERASHATRIILDRKRAMFNFRVQEAKRRLDRALSALIDLPDFASRNSKPQVPMLSKETIQAYTEELKDWLADMEEHKRILMEREKEKADLLSASVEGISLEPLLTARQLLERGNCSWNDIRGVTNDLDSRILTASEHFYSDVYTTLADSKDQASGLQDPHPTTLTTITTQGAQLDAVSSSTNHVGDDLTTQATLAADLISKLHALEQRFDHVKNERQAMNKFCAEAEVHCSQFEHWKQNDKAILQQMTEQLQTLHLLNKLPKTSVPTLPPAQLDGMILQLRPVVIDHLKKEVQPIFDALRNRCLENLEGSKNLIEELVTPALVMTDDICHRVSTLSCDDILDSK